MIICMRISCAALMRLYMTMKLYQMRKHSRFLFVIALVGGADGLGQAGLKHI